MGSSGGGDSTTVSRQELPAEVKPFLTPYLQESYNLSHGPFPQQQIAAQSPQLQQALAGTYARASAGSPLNAASQGYAGDVIGGKYLGSNPWLDATANRARAGVDSTYSLAGRYGSGAHDTAVTEALAPYYFGNYQNERGLQQNMAQYAPQLAGTDYQDLAAARGVGTEQSAYAQALLDAQRQNALAPWTQHSYFGQDIYGYPNRTTTQTGPSNNPSTLQQITGGLLGLGGLATGIWG